MSPTHIAVILLRLPLKAITGPVVTPSHCLSKISELYWQYDSYFLFLSQQLLKTAGWSWFWNMADNKDGTRITVCDREDNAEWLRLEIWGQTDAGLSISARAVRGLHYFGIN